MVFASRRPKIAMCLSCSGFTGKTGAGNSRAQLLNVKETSIFSAGVFAYIDSYTAPNVHNVGSGCDDLTLSLDEQQFKAFSFTVSSQLSSHTDGCFSIAGVLSSELVYSLPVRLDAEVPRWGICAEKARDFCVSIFCNIERKVKAVRHCPERLRCTLNVLPVRTARVLRL